MNGVDELKAILERFSPDKILFSDDFGFKIRIRPYLSQELVLDITKNRLDRLVEAKLQEKSENKAKYKTVFDIDQNHDFVIVYKVFKDKVIILTAYKTDRKCQKRLSQKLRRA